MTLLWLDDIRNPPADGQTWLDHDMDLCPECEPHNGLPADTFTTGLT